MFREWACVFITCVSREWMWVFLTCISRIWMFVFITCASREWMWVFTTFLKMMNMCFHHICISRFMCTFITCVSRDWRCIFIPCVSREWMCVSGHSTRAKCTGRTPNVGGEYPLESTIKTSGMFGGTGLRQGCTGGTSIVGPRFVSIQVYNKLKHQGCLGEQGNGGHL